MCLEGVRERECVQKAGHGELHKARVKSLDFVLRAVKNNWKDDYNLCLC